MAKDALPAVSTAARCPCCEAPSDRADLGERVALILNLGDAGEQNHRLRTLLTRIVDGLPRGELGSAAASLTLASLRFEKALTAHFDGGRQDG